METLNNPLTRGVSFECSAADHALVEIIIKRAIARDLIPRRQKTHHTMNLTAAHCNGCPLDLYRMATWERDFDIAHDLYALDKHVSRDTGKITDPFFVPRFAKRA